jgi:uroporphyrinogen-III decarboxylase
MNPRERLIATLKGDKVDRLAVSFYEIGGFNIDPDDPDKYNVYNSPSWKPLLQLADNYTDIIRLASPVRAESHSSWSGNSKANTENQIVEHSVWEEGDDRFTRLTYNISNKKLTSLTRRNKDIDTVWTIEPLLKNIDDVKTFLKLPDEVFEEQIDIKPLLKQETELGDKGILMVDTEDPLCAVATLFSMEDFTVFAFTEQDLCHKLLEKHARYIHKRTEQVAREFPGRLWRIYGPEFATEPFLPSHLFEQYVVRYDKPMVEMIKRYNGFARLHAHGNIKGILDYLPGMKVDAIDPIEPPPQGDVELEYVRQKYGKEMVLFGNLEVSDIENMPSDKFRQIVRNSIKAGTMGAGRGFVLMPSSSPCTREISELTLRNYQIIIEELHNFSME